MFTISLVIVVRKSYNSLKVSFSKIWEKYEGTYEKNKYEKV